MRPIHAAFVLSIVGLASGSASAQDLGAFSAQVKALAGTDGSPQIAQVAREQCETAASDASVKGLDDPRAALQRATTYADCLKMRRGVIPLLVTADKNLPTRELIQPDLERAEGAVKEAGASVEFLGLSFGVGFGVSYAVDPVEEGALVGTQVRVTSDRRWQPRAVLEFHKFLTHDGDGRTPASRGSGPFLAVAATEEKLLSGVGTGWMWGWKSRREETDGFCLALGVILDGKVRSLARGFKEGAVPPNGETEIRYKEQARLSALAFVTRSF